MRVQISVANADHQAELASLYRWFNLDDTLRRQARVDLAEAGAAPGTMGAYEIVDVALTHGAALGSLLVSFLTWRGTRSSQPPITINVDARSVTLPDGTPPEVQALLAALAPPPAQPDETDTTAASGEETGASA